MKDIIIHPHAESRAAERGASKEEIISTINEGEELPAKFDRICFRKNFNFEAEWNKKFYSTKQVEAYCASTDSNWIVITIIVKYF